MLEVSLPEHIINFFKLTCRNYTYRLDGSIKQICTCKKGRLHGETIVFFDNGNIRMILSYKNGKEDGQCVEYWPDHSIRATYKYKNGLLDGTYFEYHPFSNNVYAVSEYGVRNINPESINLSGPYLICTQEYVRGVKHGLEICLYKNAAEILSSIANLLMPSLLKKHLLNKENNKNVRS